MGNTVIRALYLVARSLNCKLYLEHINRCSRPEDVVTNMLSKSNFMGMRGKMRHTETFPRRTSFALVKWVRNPKPNRNLGDWILGDMAFTTRLLGHSRIRKSRWDI